MDSRELGSSGILVSAVGLGCNNFGMFQDREQATSCIHAALECGITLFDMASEHGAGAEEELVGAALRGHRDEVVIATKVGQPELLRINTEGRAEFSDDASRSGLSRRWIMRSVEESLTRLGTDYIDLYQPHVYDCLVAREETLTALDDLVEQGKVRAIGEAATSASVDHLIAGTALAEALGLARFSSMQARYNLLDRAVEREAVPELERRGMSLIPYMPLANGILTGKYSRGAEYPAGSRLDRVSVLRRMIGDREWERVDALAGFSAERGISMTHLAIAWLLARPVVASVIAGASRPEQVRDNCAAGSVTLSDADLIELDRITDRDGRFAPDGRS